MPQDEIYFSVPITKATETADGSVFVEGIATNDTLDLDQQIIDKDFAARGLKKWFQDWANVRQMHNPGMAPAGKAVEMRETGDGIWVRTKVVESGAVKLVKEGVYQAYSVGIAQPRIAPHPVAKGGAVIDGIFMEISLVDYPSNPTCKFLMAKRAGGLGDVEDIEKTVTAELQKRNVDPGVGGGTDRDKIPAADFAGPDRSFPIRTPKDVKDAWGLAGHADNPEAVRRRIKAIARRKGPAFVAALPDTASNGGSTSTKMKDDSALDGKPEPDEDDAQKTLPDHTEPDGDEDGPDIDGDGDGAKPTATKPYDVGNGPTKTFPPKDPEDAEDAADGGADEASEGEDPGEDDAEKAGDGDPEDAEDAADGGADEAAEGEDPGEDDAEKAKPFAKKGADLPYHLTRLHDALCPAYAEDDLLIAHPATVKGIPELVSLDVFSQAITDALAPESMHLLKERSDAYQAAVMLKTGNRKALAAELAELRKAFSEYYPTAHPVPGNIDPGQFSRGFLTEGRADVHGGHANPNPQGHGQPHDPANVQRGPLTDGRARASATKSGTSREGALSSLHDYLAAHNPAMCCVEQPGGMLSSSPKSEPTVTDADNKADAQLTSVTPSAGIHKVAEVSKLVQTEVEKAFDAKIGTLKETIEALTERVHELESAPDPATVAVRNASVGGSLRKSAQASEDAGMSDEAGRLIRLVKAARSHDSNTSVPAMERLLNEVGPNGLADLLK